MARSGAPVSQTWQRVALGLGLGLAILGALYVGTKGLPSIGGASAQSAAASAEERQQQAQLDQRRVAELKALVEKDPTNKDALFELGEIYIEAGKWQESLDWLTRFLALEPASLQARMDVGTDNFNLGRTGEAKAAWEEVARRNPSDPQIHYNLGFLYANAPAYRDLAAARREWGKVRELAPNSELAKIAQSSLDALPKAGQ